MVPCFEENSKFIFFNKLQPHFNKLCGTDCRKGEKTVVSLFLVDKLLYFFFGQIVLIGPNNNSAKIIEKEIENKKCFIAW